MKGRICYLCWLILYTLHLAMFYHSVTDWQYIPCHLQKKNTQLVLLDCNSNRHVMRLFSLDTAKAEEHLKTIFELLFLHKLQRSISSLGRRWGSWLSVISGYKL
jgi:hypothetical protein